MRKQILSIATVLAIATTSLVASNELATVNGESITNNDVEKLLRGQNLDFASLPKDTKDRILQQLIEKKLLTQKAVKSGIQKDKRFVEALENIKNDLALEVWMQKEFVKVEVSDKEKKDYYNKNKDKFKTPATLEARHILVKTEKEAKDVIGMLNKAKNKQGSFEELAKKFSIGPTKDKGGYLGKFQANQMVPEFSQAASALKKGEYSKTPVKTQFGFHVIYLEDKQDSSSMNFEDVEAKISQAITQEKYGMMIKDIVAKLKKDAKIVIK